jgi:hypothetical protein
VPALGVGALLERLNDRIRLLKAYERLADPHRGTLQAAADCIADETMDSA